MTSEQRKRLMKRVEEGGENKRLSHAECLQLARELNLSPEQVLCMRALLFEYYYLFISRFAAKLIIIDG